MPSYHYDSIFPYRICAEDNYTWKSFGNLKTASLWNLLQGKIATGLSSQFIYFLLYQCGSKEIKFTLYMKVFWESKNSFTLKPSPGEIATGLSSQCIYYVLYRCGSKVSFVHESLLGIWKTVSLWNLLRGKLPQDFHPNLSILYCIGVVQKK